MTGQVSRMQGQTPNSEMGAIGYVVAGGVGLLLLPVLPLAAVLWLLTKLGGNEDRRRSQPS